MHKWLAMCIIDGYDGLGQPLSYSKAISDACKKFKLDEDETKQKVNQILILNGREDLIEK